MTEAIGAARGARCREAIRAGCPARPRPIHRLLGAGPSGFGHHAGNLLAIDVLVVDEASMLDLALATQLLEAVPDAARIVLLGDKDQLAAVESGAVFAELSADPSLGDACRADLAALHRHAGRRDRAAGAGAGEPRCATRRSGSARNYRFAARLGHRRASPRPINARRRRAAALGGGLRRWHRCMRRRWHGAIARRRWTATRRCCDAVLRRRAGRSDAARAPSRAFACCARCATGRAASQAVNAQRRAALPRRARRARPRRRARPGTPAGR